MKNRLAVLSSLLCSKGTTDKAFFGEKYLVRVIVNERIKGLSLKGKVKSTLIVVDNNLLLVDE